MAFWLQRLKFTKQSLSTAAIATAITAFACLTIWYPASNVETEMTRFGTSLAKSVAHMSAGHIVHKDRIELAVLANELIVQEEVAGVAFYDTANDILAMSGTSEMINQYTAPATLDDTITGYVSIVLDRNAFAAPGQFSRWLLTILTLALTPMLAVGVLQFSAQGNRSLPIVTVPEPETSEPQESFAIYINLHNQLALSQVGTRTALHDAMTMAQEVCAIHHGIATELDARGLLLLFDRTSVDAEQAICGSALIQTLLDEFDTEGEFRCYLDVAPIPQGPTDMAPDDLTACTRKLPADDALIRAAMARKGTILLSDQVYDAMKDTSWVSRFTHPILEDDDRLYLVEELPEAMAELVAKQSQLILGFN